MKTYGFIRVAAAVPVVRVADTVYNTEEICRMTSEASEMGVSLVVYPELSVTGYSCGDLFFQKVLLDKAEEGIARICGHSKGMDITIVAGVPVPFRNRIYNCAAVIRNGALKGLVPKTYLSAHDGRSETGLFSSGADLSGEETVCIEYAGYRCPISTNLIFESGKVAFGIETGNDNDVPVPPSALLSLAGAQIIVNPSAVSARASGEAEQEATLKSLSKRNICGYIHTSAGYGESTQDVVFCGKAAIMENGDILNSNTGFSMESGLTLADIDHERIDTLRQRKNTFGMLPCRTTGFTRIDLGDPVTTDLESHLFRPLERHPFIPAAADMDRTYREIISIQTTGLTRRLEHIGAKSAVIGVSGGLDSTLALIVTVLAADRLGWNRKSVIGVTMPGYGTSSRTKGNADLLMEILGITAREISITAACGQHFEDIGHDVSVHDATFENSQARERTQILMDMANQTGGIVVGTGDLSELALGWATYNGDHMSMYGVNAGIPKSLMQSLTGWVADNIFKSDRNHEEIRKILTDIIDTPISPELLPSGSDDRMEHRTEDIVGPYELHDFILYNMLQNGYSPEKIGFLARKAFPDYSRETIAKWLGVFMKRFFSQQFKRSCLPDGPKTGEISLSPRGAWKMPSDAWSTLFRLKE